MIENLIVKNFKSIREQFFSFSPLTILTGTNSCGKSSIIQAILFYANSCELNLHLEEYLNKLGDYKELLNFNAENNLIEIIPSLKKSKPLPILSFDIENNKKELKDKDVSFPSFEKDIFYLSSNRIGQEDIAKFHNSLRSGINGEYLFGYYEKYKNEICSEKLIKDNLSKKLSVQVRFWINEILDLKLEPKTEKINNTNVSVVYESDGFNFSPFNLGAGVSYLSKIIILGLSLKSDDILIVENPEIHLHPKAISKLANFFVFLSDAGIQVILETHSEHIINKIRYAVFKRQLSKDFIQIYYKNRVEEQFIPIKINKEGKFIDIENQVIEFPKGFFDGDLSELLEMM